MSSAIKAKTEALAQVAMKLGEAMYKAQPAGGGDAGGGPQGGPGGPGGGPGGPGDDKVVDADFEEVDDRRSAARPNRRRLQRRQTKARPAAFGSRGGAPSTELATELRPGDCRAWQSRIFTKSSASRNRPTPTS